jgi:hypothetical protein
MEFGSGREAVSDRRGCKATRGYVFRVNGELLLMNVTLVVCLYLVGAAGLALWLVARFPALGPSGIGTSLAIVIAAFMLLDVTQGLTGSVSRAEGPAAALLLVVLPTLTLMFWACARLLRAFVERLTPYGR